MAWNDQIPQPNNKLRVSQGDLLANFQALNTYLTVNHTAIDGTGDQGKHKFIEMPEQAAIPVFTGNEIGLYAKIPAVPFPLTTLNELFIRKEDGDSVPITAREVNIADTSDGWTYLPSGLLMKWNRVTITADNDTYNFTTTGIEPAFTGVPVVIATRSSVGSNTRTININGATTTSFDWRTDQAAGFFRFFAIGQGI